MTGAKNKAKRESVNLMPTLTYSVYKRVLYSKNRRDARLYKG